MTTLENGMMVQHASLGAGKIVAVEPDAVHVVFAMHDARLATKLRLPMALSFLSAASGSNARLSGIGGFALDQKSGRYERAPTWLSHSDAVARFTESFPLAFSDPGYVAPEKGRGDRASRWRKAHLAYVAALGDGQAERLLAGGDVAALVERTLGVERIVRTLHRDAERTSLEAGLADPARARIFFGALLELVAAAAPDREKFEALAAAVAALTPDAVPEARWPVITLLPFVARPDVHMLLRPRFACDVAERLGLELAYAAAPGWATYASLLKSSAQLLEKLRPLGARDHVDVEAFMHAATAKQGRAKAPPRPPSPSARGAPKAG